MNDHLSKNEREALLADAHDGALSPDEAAELSMLTDVLADPAVWTEPRADLEDSVVQAVTEVPTSTATSPRRETAPLWQRAAVSAFAAAAAIALALGLVANLGGGTRPDYNASLTATQLAPGASASVAIRRNNAGFRVTLDAHGLPRLAAGEYYQAWLKNTTGTLVPIGTFSSSDGRITLWSGVSPTAFPTLTITIERPDNDQKSSGRRVLVGTVHQR
jgi:anti-sigma-K factor RskA